MPYLIFAVEDDESIRELYSYALENAGFGVECFESGAQLFSRLADVKPDLFLLDVMLDGMNGFEILSKIRTEGKLKDTPVIMVSAKGDEVSKVKGLNLGADDYVGKPFGILELVARINANLRKVSGKKKRIEYKDVQLDDVAHKLTVGGNAAACTLKEYELLKFLLNNAESVVKRDEILDKVWNTDFAGESRTLDVHIQAIRKMLSSYDSKVEIETVRGVGFILK